MLVRRRLFVYLSLFICILAFTHQPGAADEQQSIQQRLELYKKIATVTHVPWYYLAAFDQYERNINKITEDGTIGIQFSDELWYGAGNVNKDASNEAITLFNGIGRDGNGDGQAIIDDPEDVLFTAANILLVNGWTEDDIKISLWQYYQRDLSVKTIVNIAKVYRHFQTIELLEREFPVSIRHNYSYRSTWGHRRGFGGNRIHEGTDIFANYGTPVIATTYGVVELKGWNTYGGWRIGIRDIHNIYHYYAHLNHYAKGVKIGDIVKPGDLLGTVGSSGYGPPGTAGKFPPHLHYGMYKDNGRNEWSFDPYPYLIRWERMARQNN